MFVSPRPSANLSLLASRRHIYCLPCSPENNVLHSNGFPNFSLPRKPTSMKVRKGISAFSTSCFSDMAFCSTSRSDGWTISWTPLIFKKQKHNEIQLFVICVIYFGLSVVRSFHLFFGFDRADNCHLVAFFSEGQARFNCCYLYALRTERENQKHNLFEKVVFSEGQAWLNCC